MIQTQFISRDMMAPLTDKKIVKNLQFFDISNDWVI